MAARPQWMRIDSWQNITRSRGRLLRMKCPKCDLQLDFEGRYIVREDFEAGAPAQIRDMEVWKCDNCGSYYEASRSGQPVPIRFMQSLFKRLE